MVRTPLRFFVWAFGFFVATVYAATPPHSDTIELQVTFPALPTGTSEPLVVTGVSGAGDFLFVRYLDPQTIQFGYDSWGRGGPASKPLAAHESRRRSLRVQMPSLQSLPDRPVTVGELHVTLDGEVVLEATVSAHPRKPDQIYIGRNPLGGDLRQPTVQRVDSPG